MHADTEEGEDGTVDGPVPPVDGEADGRLTAQGGNTDRKWQQAKSRNKRRMKEGPCSLPAPRCRPGVRPGCIAILTLRKLKYPGGTLVLPVHFSQHFFLLLTVWEESDKWDLGHLETQTAVRH